MTRPYARLTLGCTVLLLAGCSQTAPTAAPDAALPPGSPYAGGQQYPWSDRLDAPGADPYADGRRYPWASPTAASGVNAQALNTGQNHLSDLQWTSASSGWGPVERDRSNGEQGQKDGGPMKVGGRTFAKGLGVHAASEIRYALGGQCNVFTAFVGIDEEVGGRGSAQFRVFGDGRLLFDSGVRRGRDLSLPVNVSVAGVKELRLSVSDGGDTHHYDHADWGDAAVECASAQPEGDVFLSDLPYASASSGWGPVEFDRSNGEQRQFDGRALTIGGRVFDKGLGVHAFSILSYDLGGRCHTFSAQLGLDDEVGARGSVVFQVYGDDRKLYDSGVLRGSDAARRATVKVSGVKALKLIVTDAGDHIDYDHADWADAKLSCAPGAVAQSGTLDSGFGSGGRVGVGGVDGVAEPDGAVAVLDADFRVSRLSPSGAVLARGAALPNGVAHALARQADGKLVAVGGLDGEMAAVRYLSNLTLDPSFGAGGVVRLTLSQQSGHSTSTNTGSAALDVALQPDGRIVLGGYAQRPYSIAGLPAEDRPTSYDLALVRLTQAGTTDASFGQNGAVITSLNGNRLFDPENHLPDEKIYGVALQPDGKLVIVGESEVDGAQYAVLGRYLSSGQLDSGFGSGGLAAPAGSYSGFRTVALQPDGQIVAGGGDDRFLTTAYLQKFSSAGVGGARARFQFSSAEDASFQQTVVTSLLLDSDGSVVVGGYNDADAYVARFTSTLQQDAAFGGAPGGHVLLGKGRAVSLVGTTDNRIVATTAATEGGQGQGTYRLFR
ncbi:NPCBM/NEW2 domain-containing protein [Deinococcus sp. D7000]|nr:NPCBM/NEW2 domain-containing protein [Deinococcus sp. D7000]